MTVHLRPAALPDAGLLWAWANDPAARQASGNPEPIGWEDHVAWLTQRLASADVMIAIGCSASGEPVGSIRFETSDRWETARVSYQVAPEARGAGIGRRLLEAGSALVATTHPAARLVALVRPENGASLHLFRTLGWSEEEPAGEFARFGWTPELAR